MEAARNYFFPFMREWKQTNINNVSSCNTQSGEYLFAISINCLVDETLRLVEKKIVNTVSHKLKLKLSDAQAVVLYRMLIILPLPEKEFYLNKLRNDWIEQLDGQLLAQHIYQQHVQKRINTVPAEEFDFDDS